VTVVNIDRGKIRLGIEAPLDVVIVRQELLPPGHPLGLNPTAPPATAENPEKIAPAAPPPPAPGV
jgi:carbon storage regulator